jgi:hypothetical protein
MRHWRYNAHAGVLQPRIAPFKLATRFSVSIFSGDLIIHKVGLFVAAATPDPSAPTVLIVQTMPASPWNSGAITESNRRFTKRLNRSPV